MAPSSPSSSGQEANAEIVLNAAIVEGTASNSVKLGTLKGVPILVHWSVIFLLAFNCLTSLIYTNPLEVLLFDSIFWGPMVILSLFVHELGHYVVTKKLGGEVDQIILWPLGGLSIFGPTDRGVMGDLKVAVAGPIMQIPIMIIFAIVYLALQTPDMAPFYIVYLSKYDIGNGIGFLFLALCRVTFWYNVFLFGINLVVPISPLDGLRIWAACLRTLGLGVNKTAKSLAYVGMLISLIVFVYGVFILFDLRKYGGIAEMFLGAYGFASSKALHDLVSTDRLSLDPVFGRSLYIGEESRNVEMSGASSNNPSNQPAQPLPVEVAESSEIL